MDISNYKNVYGHCPKCNSIHILMDTTLALTTHPAQYNFMCQECDHTWTDFEKTQFPTATAWPSSEGPVPIESLNYGWICPKCGRVYAPHMSWCTNCNGTYSPNFVYCGTTGGNIGDYSISNMADTTKIHATNTTITRNHIDGTLTATFGNVSEDK